MNVTLRIERFDPEKDQQPYVQAFEVEVQPTDRVLDALMEVKRRHDGTLAFRKSCAHGVCGSDAMLINGVERLACKTLIQDVTAGGSTTIDVAPLRSMPVQRDLMVDQSGFFDAYRRVKPFLMTDRKPDEKEYRQSPEERARFDDATNCILCASCYSACPVVREKNPDFVGPAASVQAARFVLDSRDDGVANRMDVLDAPNGVWACENHFDCTKVCPRGIKVTKNINALKRTIKAHKEPGH
jgi:succinate dehydrogenase / fumarate reductase iron-sulfur subunit